MTFERGREFSTYEEFDKELKEFQRKTGAIFVIQSSHKCKEDSKLKYSYFKVVCKHYGNVKKMLSSRGKLRPNQSSFKIGCPAFIQAGGSTKTNKLVITKSVLEHNHEIANNLSIYPENRRLDDFEKSTAVKMLEMGASVKRVRDYLIEMTGKPIIYRDIHNLRVQKNKMQIQAMSDVKLLRAMYKRMLEKNRLVSNITKKINDLVCSVSHGKFLGRLELLEDLLDRWASNKSVKLVDDPEVEKEPTKSIPSKDDSIDPFIALLNTVKFAKQKKLLNGDVVPSPRDAQNHLAVYNTNTMAGKMDPAAGSTSEAVAKTEGVDNNESITDVKPMVHKGDVLEACVKVDHSYYKPLKCVTKATMASVYSAQPIRVEKSLNWLPEAPNASATAAQPIIDSKKNMMVLPTKRSLSDPISGRVIKMMREMIVP